jgi:hypothetical protein
MPDREQLLLTQLAVKVSRAMPQLGSFTSEKAHLEAVKNEAFGMMLELRSAVLGAQILSDTQAVSIEYPATWWQHLKQDHAPAWFTRRWPVRMTRRVAEVNFTRYDTYPMADVPLPPDDFGYPVVIEMFRLLGPSEARIEPSGKPRYKYASHHALGFLIANDLLDNGEDAPPSQVRRVVLATLARLKHYGVNSDQLVREDVLRSMGG